MAKIIDGTGAVLGRLASYAAKQALLGEEVVIVNSEKVIITGNKKNIIHEFNEQRTRTGSSQQGPKISRLPYMIVKRAVRGMLSHRQGRGKVALQRIKCYEGIPEQYKDAKKIVGSKEKPGKFIEVNELRKHR